MKRAVWKYGLAPEQVAVVTPAGSRLMYVTDQHDAIVLYALVDPNTDATEIHNILIVGTGHWIGWRDDGSRLTPLGVAKLAGGHLMIHVFEVDQP